MSYSKAFEYLHGVHRQTRNQQLTETLYINALQELRLAKEFSAQSQFDQVHLHCTRIHKILVELNRSLDKRYRNEFCLNQEALYGFCFESLRLAWHQGQDQAFAELEEVLEGLLRNWQLCMKLMN